MQIVSLRAPLLIPWRRSHVEVLSTRCVLHHGHNNANVCYRHISNHSLTTSSISIDELQQLSKSVRKGVLTYTAWLCSYPGISSDLGRYQIGRLSWTSSSSENLLVNKANTMLMYANLFRLWYIKAPFMHGSYGSSRGSFHSLRH